MTIDKDDLSALKELAEKGGAFSTLMYEYMMSLDEVELHSKVIEFLNKVDSIIYDLEKEFQSSLTAKYSEWELFL